jgi:hypothetical protein
MEVTAIAADQACQGSAARRLAIRAGAARDEISSGILCAIRDAQMKQEQKIAVIDIIGCCLGSIRVRAKRVASRARFKNTQA